MILHDPLLTLNIEKYEKRELNYFFYNKNDHINLEGFGKNDASLVILNPPMLKNKFAYQGIKPAVYIITHPDEKIIEICQKNQALINSSKHTKSNKNSFDVSPDSVEKVFTANSNKDLIDIKEHEKINDIKTLRDIESKVNLNNNNNFIENKESLHKLKPDNALSYTISNPIVIDKNTMTIAIGKLVIEDYQKSNNSLKIKPTNNNSPQLTTFSNDALSVPSLEIMESNKDIIICYDQSLKKNDLSLNRSTSLERINNDFLEHNMDNYIIEDKNNQFTMRKKPSIIINSAKINEELIICCQTAMNNEKPDNLSPKSFKLKLKNDKKSVLNTDVTPKNDRINHQRIKSSNTGSFSSNNYILSEDNSVNNINCINKHISLSRKSTYLII